MAVASAMLKWNPGLVPWLCLVAAASSGLAVALEDIPFWMNYADTPYLNTWALETFSNFPSAWWDTNLMPCPAVGDPGFLGVTCSETPTKQFYVTAIDLSKASLPSLPGSDEALSGSFKVPPFIVGLQFLSSLNLSGQNLTGSLPATISYAPKLVRLDLKGNGLSGPIPPELCDMVKASIDGCLNLANNNFSGSIPACLSYLPCVDFEGNPNLPILTGACDAAQTNPSCWPKQTVVQAPPPPPAQEGSIALPAWAIVLIVIGGLLLIAAIVAGVIFWKRRQRQFREAEEKRLLTERIESELTTRRFGVLKRFQSEELAEACNSFSDDNYLGEGGFSTVFKGTLEDGTVIAVKKMKMDNAKPGVELNFINEVEIISRASHKNLAQCMGFCVETGENLMLALKFYSNGSVANRTRGKEGNPLGWLARRRIAKGAAEGIAYLHGDCDPMIIHRDIKAENILLDDKDEPVVADFGLATEMEADESNRNTAIQGTLGHIAPEYFMTGKCSVKTDVYAFGVFLLELSSGQDIFTTTIDNRAQELGLHDWLMEMVESEKVNPVVDPELHHVLAEGADDSILEVLRVATLCVRNDPAERPTMDQVSSMLSDGKGLASNWARWQAEAGKLTGEEIMKEIDPAAWDNMTTGVKLDPETLHGPGR